MSDYCYKEQAFCFSKETPDGKVKHFYIHHVLCNEHVEIISLLTRPGPKTEFWNYVVVETENGRNHWRQLVRDGYKVKEMDIIIGHDYLYASDLCQNHRETNDKYQQHLRMKEFGLTVYQDNLNQAVKELVAASAPRRSAKINPPKADFDCRLENTRDGHNKFWEAYHFPGRKTYTVIWGKIGTSGQIKDIDGYLSDATSKAREKIAQGYDKIKWEER